MPTPFPHQYEATLVRTWSSRGRLEAASRPPIPCSPAPQFDGDETAWSAELLLLSSLVMSLLTTFEAFAARDGVTVTTVTTWQARVCGKLDMIGGGLSFIGFTIYLDMDVDSADHARATLDDAQRHCLVANMLRVPVEVVAQIHGTGERIARSVG